jgi:PAS domain S-box-containing protein
MSAQHPPTVLVVNDDPKMLELLVELLTEEGYKTVSAAEGARALQLIEVVKIDTVICDVVMPGMDGLEVARKLKENPQTANVPILLVSALQSQDEAALKGLESGADDFLEIPFRHDELRVKVARLIERKRAGEALRASEEQYRILFQSNPHPMWVFDNETYAFLAVNDAAIRHYGYSREEFLSMTVKDIRLPDDIPVLMAGLAKRRTHDMVGIRRHRKKDGTLINVEISWHSLDFEGRPARLVLASDVTERKNAEAALRESEESYRELFENANDIIYTHDLTGNFTSLNKAGEKITGYSREEAGRMNIADVLAPDYVTVARQMLARKAISEGATVYELEIIAKGGERVALEVSTRLVYRDNVPVAVQGIGRDITERKRTQDALRETQSFFHTFMNNSPAIAFLKDEAGRYVYVNEPFERLFGQKLEFLRGRTSFDWLAKDTAQQTHDNDLEVLTTGLSQEIVETVPTPDGTPHHWLVFKFPTTDASGQKLVGGVGVDITERRLAEEALSQQAEREAMTNRISQAVRRSLDLGEVFHTAVSELGAHLEVDRCSLFMRNDKSGVVTNVAEFHVPEVTPAGHDFEFGEVGSLVAALEKESALIFNDVASDPGISDLYQRILREADVRSIMYVAIRVGDETPAAFALSTTKQARRWSESDIAIAKAVADQTGIAIRQAKLYQSAEATSTRETLANSLSLAIRASLSLPEVLSAATRELGRALSASRVHWRRYDSENGSLPLQHEYVAPGCASVQHIDVDHGAALGKHLLNSLAPLIVDDALNCSDGPPEFASYIRETAELLQLKSQIVYPVVVDGQFRGALCIDQADRVRCWTDDEVALVGSVAVQLAIGIAQAELFELVARAKKEWESTFDAMSDGIFIFERTGRLMRVNRAGAAFEQLTPQLLSGRQCCDILRTSADDAFCIVEKAIAESRSVTLEIMPIELKRPLLVTVEPIFARDGQTAGAVCTARDVTELRKIEAVAREQQSLLTNILESARESIYAVDAAGRFQWCNSATLKGLGCRREDFIGANLLDLIHEEDRHMVGEHFVSALAGQPQTYEMRYFSADGNLQYARVDNAPLVVEGRTTGVLGIARDITAQKQERERAARADKLRALGQLASGVAHDFNNSLAAILGRAQLMRRHLNDEASIRNLDVIQTAAEDAAATVRRIQTFARKTHAKEFELLDVSQLVSDAVEITRTRWENEARLRGLNIDVSVSAEEALFTHGNASELREVFVNLIVNAVDAMPHGGKLTINCSRAGERLSLRFCDTGTGMEEEVRQKVFEPFYTTKGMQGTGLGLAVSYGIIERHEGLITVESKLGHGTTFVIDLPVAAAKPAVAAVAVEAVQGSLSVLVVDDELFVRETLSDMLSELSHRVVAADCGRAALAEFTSQPFDLVFTDLAMPEMDGWATARALRKLRPEVPVVMVTGYGATAEAPDGELDLISGVIGKPFDFLQVSETIARVVGKQTSSDILPLLPV